MRCLNTGPGYSCQQFHFVSNITPRFREQSALVSGCILVTSPRTWQVAFFCIDSNNQHLGEKPRSIIWALFWPVGLGRDQGEQGEQFSSVWCIWKAAVWTCQSQAWGQPTQDEIYSQLSLTGGLCQCLMSHGNDVMPVNSPSGFLCSPSGCGR